MSRTTRRIELVEVETTGAAERRHQPSDITEFDRERYAFAASFVRGKTVLDAACGIGYGSQMLAAAGAVEVVGVDGDPSAIASAERWYSRAGVSFACADCQGLEGSFDVIVSLETIEHLEDGGIWAEHLAALLAIDGVAVVSTPVRRTGGLNDQPDNPYHVREWSPQEFDALLRRHFGQVSLHYQGFAPPRVGGLRVLRPLLRGLALRKLVIGGPAHVLGIDEWFDRHQCRPLNMIAVCQSPRRRSAADAV